MQDLVEFTNQNLLLVTGFVASGLAVIFYELRLKTRSIGAVSTAVAVQLINKGSTVVDIRDADKFAAGHIIDARNVPQDELTANPDQLSKNKHGTLLVCDTGANSSLCAAQLRKDGIENVFSISGGVRVTDATDTAFQLHGKQRLEPKGIWSLPGFPRRLRPAALLQYLTFSFVPGRHTMLEDVFELPPGSYLEFDGAGDPVVETHFPFRPQKPRFCIFEHVYFSRPDSILGGRSVYETREAIGRELAKESPVEADLVCPVPDSGTPAAIGYSLESGIPYAMGIIRNQYMGRTFIEPTEQIRNMGVRLKLNVNRALIEGKRVILVDDSVVRGTTSRKIKEMILDAGAKEVHFRIASPPTAWPCFYGVDTPQREKLLAATMSEEEMRAHLQVDSLRFISLDGLYRAVGEKDGRDPGQPQYCDACFSGEYPVEPADQIEDGFQMKPAAE